MDTLSIEMIQDAASIVQGNIRKTPIEYSSKLSQIMGVPVYLKLEFLQITGSFKLRGALYKLSKLSQKEKNSGVITCSAGNHGKAIAYVGKKMGIKSTIYVPRDVDESKYLGILEYGAEIVRSPYPGYDDTMDLALKDAKESGKQFISPFDTDEIMASNGGTIALEVLEDIPQARNFIMPIGGGGLAAGFSYFVKDKMAKASVIGCQHRDSPGLKLSLEKGEAVTRLPAIETIAGGIEGGLGANCFKYLKTRIDEVALVSEKEIKEAVAWGLENHQYLIEPSGAAPIAACISGKIKNLEGPTVLILTGRNVSLGTLKKIIGS